MSRSVFVTDLSASDLARLQALRSASGKPDALVDRDVLRAGLDALDKPKPRRKPKKAPATLDSGATETLD